MNLVPAEIAQFLCERNMLHPIRFIVPLKFPAVSFPEGERRKLVMLRLSYLTVTVLSNKIARNRIVLSFKDRLENY